MEHAHALDAFYLEHRGCHNERERAEQVSRARKFPLADDGRYRRVPRSSASLNARLETGGDEDAG